MRPEILLAMMVANEVYKQYGYDFVITSVTDGKHHLTSNHYTGNAFDCRIYHKKDKEIQAEIKNRLNIDYDVLLENNHIHIQYKPRYR